jgi:hypothetical protein
MARLETNFAVGLYAEVDVQLADTAGATHRNMLPSVHPPLGPSGCTGITNVASRPVRWRELISGKLCHQTAPLYTRSRRLSSFSQSVSSEGEGSDGVRLKAPYGGATAKRGLAFGRVQEEFAAERRVGAELETGNHRLYNGLVPQCLSPGPTVRLRRKSRARRGKSTPRDERAQVICQRRRTARALAIATESLRPSGRPGDKEAWDGRSFDRLRT